MSQTETNIVPAAQVPIVLPPLKTEELIAHFLKIQDLKRKLIDPSTDTIKIVDKTYILKSGWRKLAFAFNLSDEIVREEKETTSEGEVVWHMWVKVTAPNGRSVIGVAAASTAEREFAHEEHDPYALCHTRAKNRAISDILGLGEVSAEEMTPTRRSAVASTSKPVEKPAPPPPQKEIPVVVKVRMLKDMPNPIHGEGDKYYGPFKAEDVAFLPKANVEWLIQNGVASEIVPVGETREVPVKDKEEKATGWMELKAKDGKVYGTINRISDKEVEVMYTEAIDMENPQTRATVENFLLNKILVQMQAKAKEQKKEFDYKREGGDGITEPMTLKSIKITGQIDDRQIKELVSPCAWTAMVAAGKKS